MPVKLAKKVKIGLCFAHQKNMIMMMMMSAHQMIDQSSATRRNGYDYEAITFSCPLLKVYSQMFPLSVQHAKVALSVGWLTCFEMS